ncbi:MAG: 50S ribosomal protein P1 [Candidatus Aenigmatarchaeota archaeon]|nr:50S ribosomal protein P1 [Candidatus Aenigmarchaeota archaeon]RLJ03977.1 MAG: 50S ribosomal protein P1 [Candidatus Aenigmarchaeota archaeon]
MGLEYIHAALLLHEAKKDITEEAISRIVEAAGLEVDKAMTKATVENLKDVNIDEVLSSAVAAPVAAAPAAQTGGETGGEKKEEKKESQEDKEKKAEEAAAGLSSLFG